MPSAPCSNTSVIKQALHGGSYDFGCVGSYIDEMVIMSFGVAAYFWC